MSSARAVLLAVGLTVVVLGTVGDGGAASAVPTAPRTIAPSTPPIPPTPPASSVPASVPPSSVTDSTTPGAPATATGPVTIVRRGGAVAGSLAKPEDERWSVRQMLTATALGVLVLASSGYVYGRVRSAPPRHPDLVRNPE